jgi:predicted metal-dependent hydrolase
MGSGRATRKCSAGETLPGGDRIFHRIFTRLGCQGRPPRFVVELYPYANLAHTLRLREETAHVRLSDILRDAPVPVIEAAAAILLAQMYRRRVPAELRGLYREFALAHSTRRHIARIRRKRARSIAHLPRGLAHDLAPMFAALNLEYFSGRLSRPRLGWSARPWRSQFGCFDPSLDQIVMNNRLDRADVPSYAVEFILYHEMLHVKHPLRAAACGLQAHSAEFRAEEKRFKHYAQARHFLEHVR